MSDDKSQSQGQDRQRINVNQDYELRDWAKSLNTTPERLKEAVQAVGDRAEKVREYLKNDKPGR
jgi:methyl-accepting chemotaxis protein